MPIYPAIVGVDQTTSQFNLRYKDPLSANTTDEVRINPTAKTIHAYDYSLYVKNIFGNVGANISTSNLTVDTLNAEKLIANLANIETLWTNIHYSNTSYITNAFVQRSNVQTIIVDTISANTYIGAPTQGNEFNELYANIIKTDGLNSEISVQSKLSVDGATVSLDTAPTAGAPGTADTHLAMYGDGAGGSKPYTSLAYGLTYPGYKMFAQYDGAITNQVMYKKQNLQYNSTDPLIGNDPAWEYRNYSDMNCRKVSSILCDTTGVPIDNPVCTWEWKYHRAIDIDGQPETNKTAINEQNKIAHIIRQPDSACITEIAMATNPSVINGSQDTKFRFTPDVPNEPLLAPTGTMEMDIAGTKIWDADKTDMIVYLTRDTYGSGGTRDITNASLQTRGGLWVKKKALVGDQLELVSNLSGTAIQFYNVKEVDIANSSNAGTRFEYTTSNVFQYVMPPAVSKAAETTSLKLEPSSVTLGAGTGSSINNVTLQTTQRSRIDLGDNIEINPNSVTGKTTMLFGSTTNPVIKVVNDELTIDTANVIILSNSTVPVMNVWYDNVILGTGNVSNASTVTIMDGNRRTFRQEANIVKVGYQSNTTNTATLYMDTRPWDEINVNSSDVTTLTSYWTGTEDKVFSVNSGTRLNTTDDVTLDSGSYLTVNPGLSSNVGFRIKPYTPASGNHDEDLICINGPTSQNHIQLGTAIVPVSNTTAQLTGPNYGFGRRVVNGIVHDSTVDKFAYYKTTTQLSYFVTSESGNSGELVTYDSFSNLATNFSNTTTGNIAYISLQTSNLSGNTVSQPYPEYRPTTTVKAPIVSLGDGVVRALLSTHLYECRGKFKDNLNSTTPTFSDTSLMRWNWQSSGAQYLWFQLAYAQAGNPATFPDSDSTQGRLFAPMDGWITSVTIKFYASATLEQGGGGGYINTYRQFMGFYLGKGTRGTAGNEGPGWPYAQTSDLKQFFKPTCVYRYLGYYQVPSLSAGSDVSIPATMRFDLPLEDWVYVEQGEVMPYVSMVCPLTAGAGASPNGPGTFEIVSNNSDDNADTITATVTFSALPPRVAESRGDVRWDTGMAAAFGGQPIDPVCG